MSEAGAKLPYDKAAIASWCAARGIDVIVGDHLGDGALNLHWLVHREDSGEALVFRQRAPGHWFRRGFVGEALAQTMARQAGVLAPEVLHADRQAMLMAYSSGTADREIVIAQAALSVELIGDITTQLRILRHKTGFVFQGEDRESWLEMAISDYCLARTDWFEKLEQPARARKIMAQVATLGFEGLCLSHGDFRTGNLQVNDGRLRALLDWEFAGYRPLEADVGWMLSSPWRYSRPDLPASGLMERRTLLDAIGQDDSPRLRGWEALALVRWAVIARLQDSRQGLPPGSNADETALLEEAAALVA